MRRTLWILSTPVVAGGLAWAVNAADQSPSLAQARNAQTGKIYYFSRNGGKEAGTGTDRAAAYTEAPADTVAESDDAAATQRYVRKPKAAAPAAAPKAKNYYQDLFGGETAATPAAAKKPATTTTAAKPAVAAKPDRRAIAEQYGANEASPYADEPLPREENLLPPSDTPDYSLVSGEADYDGVRHADHKEQEGIKDKNIQPVQGRVRMPPSKPAATRSLPAREELVAEPANEQYDAPAPPPPSGRSLKAAPGAKTLRPAAGAPTATAATPGKTLRPAAGAATAAASAPAATTAAAPRPRAVAKPAPAVSVSEEAAATPAIQQVSAVSEGVSSVPTVSLKWISRGELNVGQECKCGLVVTNTGKIAAKDIVVEAHFPKTVQLRDAAPFPNDTKGHLSWVFDHLGAGEEKTIEITMIPGKRGELSPSATVRFTGVASTVLQVEEPQLNVALTGPADISVGETMTQVITVSNPGSGVANEVVLYASIPEGLDYPRGKSVELYIGAIGPGESREVRLPLTAVTGGVSVLKIEARGTNLAHKAESAIQIAAPRLRTTIAGPVLRYVGRPAQYLITVTNDGVAATDNVRVVHLIPQGFGFVKADHGGRYEAGTASVSWFVGRVEAGQSVQLAVDLNAKQIGQHQHHVQASGESGSNATATLECKVDGSSAVVMEVADLADPVEIETETAYEIRIRNDGTKAAQNLCLICELPQGVELLGTDGPTESALSKGMLSFRPLTELAAGGKIAYRVKVSGKKAGTLRLRAKLTSNAAAEPLVVEELTKFYGD